MVLWLNRRTEADHTGYSWCNRCDRSRTGGIRQGCDWHISHHEDGGNVERIY